MSLTLRATTSLARSLLSMAKLNIAKSRIRPSNWIFVRVDQTSFGRSAGLAPTSLPLFQGSRFDAVGRRRFDGLAWSHSSIVEVDHGGRAVGEILQPDRRNRRIKGETYMQPGWNGLLMKKGILLMPRVFDRLMFGQHNPWRSGAL